MAGMSYGDPEFEAYDRPSRHEDAQHALLSLNSTTAAPDQPPDAPQRIPISLCRPTVLPPLGCLLVTDDSGRQFITSSKLLYRPTARPAYSDIRLIADFAKALKRALDRVENFYGRREAKMREDQMEQEANDGCARVYNGRKGPRSAHMEKY